MSLKSYSGGDMAKTDFGKLLRDKLNSGFEEQFNMATTTRGARPSTSYDINTDTYRGQGIETWHARGAEHHLVQQLEDRLAKMDVVHKQEMRNLVNQVISMNNAIEARVMHINGFYTWLIETYPETVAQYKALLNLKQLTEGEE
jgi:hypothetical protein